MEAPALTTHAYTIVSGNALQKRDVPPDGTDPVVFFLLVGSIHVVHLVWRGYLEGVRLLRLFIGGFNGQAFRQIDRAVRRVLQCSENTAVNTQPRRPAQSTRCCSGSSGRIASRTEPLVGNILYFHKMPGKWVTYAWGLGEVQLVADQLKPAPSPLLQPHAWPAQGRPSTRTEHKEREPGVRWARTGAGRAQTTENAQREQRDRRHTNTGPI